MVKALDSNIVVSKFELYYAHFQTNALLKGINHIILPAMG